MKRHLPHISFVLLSSGVFFAFVPTLKTALPVSLGPPAGIASARQSRFIFRSPLMMGGNLPENSTFVNELLTNDAALKMNQKGEDVKPVFHRDGEAVWSSHTAGSKGVNLALFNLNDEPREVTVRLSELGLRGSVRVNDVWQKKDMAPVSGSISRKLAPHACSLLILNS